MWIHGDLHAENFGTYMNSEGVLVFDVNDFDEAYLGHFTWDLRRFLASLALMGWQKALPEDDIRTLSAPTSRLRRPGPPLRQGRGGRGASRCASTTPRARSRTCCVLARMCTRFGLLDSMTEIVDYERRFIRTRVRELSTTERGKVLGRSSAI